MHIKTIKLHQLKKGDIILCRPPFDYAKGKICTLLFKLKILKKRPPRFSFQVTKIDGGTTSHGLLYTGDGMIIHSYGNYRNEEETDIITISNRSIRNENKSIITKLNNTIRSYFNNILCKIMRYPQELNGVIKEDLYKYLIKQDIIHVYRFSKNGFYLGDPEYLAKPVIDVAEHYISNKPYFPYDHLYYGPLLLLSRKLFNSNHHKLFFRLIIDNIFAIIHKCLPLDKNRSGCTAFISKCFKEACDQDKYTLEIIGQTWSDKYIEEIKNSNINKISKWLWCKIFTISKSFFRNIPTWVSPADLEKSPSLKLIGKIDINELKEKVEFAS